MYVKLNDAKFKQAKLHARWITRFDYMLLSLYFQMFLSVNM